MILITLIGIPLLGGLLAWAFARVHARAPQWIALAALGLDLCLAIAVWASPARSLAQPGAWRAEAVWPWIPRMGISLHLGLDGVSLLMVLLTLFLGIMSVAIASSDVHKRQGFFQANLLWSIAAMITVFMALDLFLFYVAWELMLIPLFLIILQWGGENRARAALKFFIFTQASSLFLLLAILGLYFIHGNASGDFTFDYRALMHTALSHRAGVWLMLGFFLAFAVKLGIVPFHGWLPDAYCEAPAAASLLLAGVMAKTGAYGLIRFVFPLFPQASSSFFLVAMILGALTIVYGAFMAIGQTDLKRLIAYTSVSHMGLILLGIYLWGPLALQGVVLLMISHGIAVGALFMIGAMLYKRTGIRDLRGYGGLWQVAPRMGGFTMVFALALMGLPGLGTFAGEVLILIDAFRLSIPFAIVPLACMVLAVVYSLRIVQKIFMGHAETLALSPPDCSTKEFASLFIMVLAIVWLGLYPKPVLDTSASTVAVLCQSTADAQPESAGRFARPSRFMQ